LLYVASSITVAVIILQSGHFWLDPCGFCREDGAVEGTGVGSLSRGEILALLIIAILCLLNYYNSFGSTITLKYNNLVTGKDELKQTQSKSSPISSSFLLEMIPSLLTSTSSPPLLRISHQLHFVDQLAP
jgi:hypothetical protein